jgi:hypothetical protein
VVGGPIGAYARGVAGGIAAESVISISDTIVYDEQRPYGHIKSLGRLVDGKMDPGEAFDWALTPVFDGLTGRPYAKTYKNLKDNRAKYRQYNSQIENLQTEKNRFSNF